MTEANTPSPDEDREMIDRLRREDHMPTYTDSLRWAPVNPDGPKAADRLESLLSDRARLDAECERAWNAYRMAHDQAMSNGEAAADARADVAKLEDALRSLLTAPMPSDYERARTALNRNTDRG